MRAWVERTVDSLRLLRVWKLQEEGRDSSGCGMSGLAGGLSVLEGRSERCLSGGRPSRPAQRFSPWVEDALFLGPDNGREQAVELVDALLERGRMARDRLLLARQLAPRLGLDHDAVRGAGGRVRRGKVVGGAGQGQPEKRDMRPLLGEGSGDQGQRKARGAGQRGERNSKSITLPVRLASFSKQNEYSPTVLAVKM